MAQDRVGARDEVEAGLAAYAPPQFPCPSCGKETYYESLGYRSCTPCTKRIYVGPTESELADLLSCRAGYQRLALEAARYDEEKRMLLNKLRDLQEQVDVLRGHKE